MEPLKLIPQCIDCLLSLTKSATLMAAPDNTSLAEKTEAAAQQFYGIVEKRNLNRLYDSAGAHMDNNSADGYQEPVTGIQRQSS